MLGFVVELRKDAPVFCDRIGTMLRVWEPGPARHWASGY